MHFLQGALLPASTCLRAQQMRAVDGKATGRSIVISFRLCIARIKFPNLRIQKPIKIQAPIPEPFFILNSPTGFRFLARYKRLTNLTGDFEDMSLNSFMFTGFYFKNHSTLMFVVFDHVVLDRHMHHSHRLSNSILFP